MLVGITSELIGRKKALAIGSLAMVTGNVILATTTSKVALMCGRALGGLGAGTQMSQVSVYASEICQVGIRPLLGAISTICYSVGFTVAFVTAALFPWRTFLGIYAAICGLVFLGQLTILIESHVWLVEKGRLNEARQVLLKSRGNEAAVDAEINKLLANIANRKRILEDKGGGDNSDSWIMTVKNRVGRGTFIRPLFVAYLMRLSTLLVGSNVTDFYMSSHLRASHLPLDPHLAAVVIATVRSLVCIASLAYVNKIRRIPICIVSLSVCCVGVLVIGINLILNSSGELSQVWSGLDWLGLGRRELM